MSTPEPPRTPAPEPAAPEPVVPESVIPEPAAPEPVVPEPAVPEPAAPEPALPSASELLAQTSDAGPVVDPAPAAGTEGAGETTAPDVEPGPAPVTDAAAAAVPDRSAVDDHVPTEPTPAAAVPGGASAADLADLPADRDPAVDDPAVGEAVAAQPADGDREAERTLDDRPVLPATADHLSTGPAPATGTEITDDNPVDTTTGTEAPSGATSDGGPAPAGRRPLLAVVAAGVVVALLAAGVGYLGLRLRDAAATDSARSEAVAASRDAARLLFSYDFKTLQDDFDRGLAVTTGEFREEYSRTTKEVVSDVATEYKAVVLADVVESAVIEASPTRVTTLVFLNQATTSTRVEGQQVDGSRVRMVLDKRDGRWLVSAVDAL